MSDSDDSGFMQSLDGIKPLKQDKIDPHAERPRARPKSTYETTQRDGSQSNREATVMPRETPEQFFQPGLQKTLVRRIRQGQVPIDARLDLHGFRQNEALRELEGFLRVALAQRLRQLLIIHGKGYNSAHEAVLRPLVQGWLSQQNEVLAWCPAQARDGGNGASYVFLRQLSRG